MPSEVEVYRRPTRILHWIHTGAFVTLFLTGLILFLPLLAPLAEDSWTRLIHRAAAVIFVVAPLIYIPLNRKTTWRGVRDAFTWGAEDLGWLKAAPAYYFLGDEAAMPPQGKMNSGQKLWWMMAIVFGGVFIITGLIMWAFKTTAPAALLQWMTFLHDVAFVTTAPMLFVHIYLGVLHPMMQGSWNAMARGRVPAEFVKAHHARWYNEIDKNR
ncbi:MAG: cytochrome b/b6 domain-containing protein [Chloroflexota bacterium]